MVGEKVNVLYHLMGLDNPSGAWYLFWSGFGGHVVVFLGVVSAFWKRWNCHESGCWRLGKHPYGNFMFCRKHHPEIE